MAPSGMLRRVALKTYVPEELSASFIRVTGIGELETTLALEDAILHSHRREKPQTLCRFAVLLCFVKQFRLYKFP
jgi:hypothetical protein